MYATEEEVGREVTCPECGAGAMVELPPGEPGGGRVRASTHPTPAQDRRGLRAGVTYIPVVCRGCKTRMYATEEEVGREVTCPDCGTKAVVERPKGEPEGKPAGASAHSTELGTGRRKPLRPGVTYILVVCERCETRMYATEDEEGREVTCPECGTKAIVERPTVQPEPKKPWQPVQIDEDEYRLCEGVDQPLPGSRAYQRYIPVVCPVCSTRMLATEDQVGRQIVCPDCTVPTTVPEPEPEPEWRGPVVVIGEEAYRLHEGVDQPPPAAAVIPVVCPLCGTRMYAAEDQAGREITCPDCQTRAVVPPAPPEARQYDPMAEASEEYRLGKPIESPEIRVGIDYRQGQRGHGDLPSDRVRWYDPEGRDPPPRWIFFSGVFTFPLYHSSLVCLIGLSLGAMVVVSMLLFTITLSVAAAQATSRASMGLFAVWSMLLFGLAFALLVLWIVVASAYLLAIIRDTANGHDAVVNWPDALFLDWVGDSYFVFSSLAIGLLPGLAMRHALDAADRETWLCVPASILVMFPILLVSMLETDSPLKPISLPVLGSLSRAWWAWGLFYVESTAVLAAAVCAAIALGGLAGLAGLLAGAPVIVAALMVYCRLLGRVIWHGSGAAAEASALASPRSTGSFSA